MRKFVTLCALAAAFAAPAFADTLQEVTTKGIVMKASIQGMELELKITYKADGTYNTDAMGQQISGKWRIDGDKLCTVSQMSPDEACTVYPAGKKSGDEFEVTHPLFGAAKVKIN
jgi:hypothetical protein